MGPLQQLGHQVLGPIRALLTDDPRFVMLKPTLIYCIVGTVMLKPGWMTRYLPPIAREITEKSVGTQALSLVGIHRRGVQLAHRIADEIEKAEGVRPPVGSLDITLYRDDLSTIAPQPVVKARRFPVPLDDRVVVLCDDVLYTGRTIRAAIDALFDYGRPERVQLAVLVDRGHRELPIRPDYVGKNLPTRRDEVVDVSADGVALGTVGEEDPA